ANLVEHLETVLGWSAAPADVMSGYGVNGNVANGSFEEVAPFGGWGWRYFDDAGVSRVHDPATAYDGENFLRLAGGAATHQNIPASDGETFTVNVWARGAMAGDELHITMDFRDQGAGAGPSTPLQTATATQVLSTEWQRYAMTATAPIGTPDPVFHTRVTFTADAGAVVDLDAVVYPDLFADGFESADVARWSSVVP
ncbi:MAG: hypothetical protein AAF657_39105, partial [Acidobacteriota bacterium]